MASSGKNSKLILAAMIFAVPMAFAEATRDVFYGMAIALAIAFLVALKFMPGGKVEEGDVPA
jgi:hypothetical protein